MLEDLLHRDVIGNRVVPIRLNTIQDHLRLLGVQEAVPVREVGDEHPCEDAQRDSEDTLEDENPLPAVEAALALEERDAVGEDRAEAAEEYGDEVESGQALLDFVSLVPGGDDERECWEEASLGVYVG